MPTWDTKTVPLSLLVLHNDQGYDPLHQRGDLCAGCAIFRVETVGIITAEDTELHGPLHSLLCPIGNLIPVMELV